VSDLQILLFMSSVMIGCAVGFCGLSLRRTVLVSVAIGLAWGMLWHAVLR